MRAWGKTDVGIARSENQDSFHIDLRAEWGAAALTVCDGMGGAKAGGVASGMAVDVFREQMNELVRNHMSPRYIADIVREAVEACNRTVYQHALSDESCSGMGTTMVGAVISGTEGLVFNIGDSRAYLINETGILRITRDHSVVEDMLIMGDLTPEEAKFYPGRNLITRALGTDSEIECDQYARQFKEGDCLMLCSDGLTNMVEEQEILYEILHGGDRSTACERLTDLANARGGKDNITVVLLEI